MNIEKEQTMEEVVKFLKDADVYYLATMDGDQPRVRPETEGSRALRSRRSVTRRSAELRPIGELGAKRG